MAEPTPTSDDSHAAGQRLVSIDMLRSLAILWVILIHLWQAVTLGFLPRRTYYERFADKVSDGDPLAALTAFTDLVFRLGDHGVTLFMIMSGLVLTMSAVRRGGIAWDRWYPPHLRKLLFPYWAGLALLVATIGLLALYRVYAEDIAFTWRYQFVLANRELDASTVINSLLIVPRGLSFEHHAQSIPSSLWFVLLLVQYYLLFPPLYGLLDRYKPALFLSAMLALSLVSTAWLVWEYGDATGGHGYAWSDWVPFRIFEFGLGMGIGYLLAHSRGAVERTAGNVLIAVPAVAAALAMHTLGSWYWERRDYWDVFSYPLITAGLGLVVLIVVGMRPGRVMASVPVRAIAWAGPISYAILIVNDALVLVNQYFIFRHWTYEPGWWFFIVVMYVPLSVALAYPLGIVLGLVPGRGARQGAGHAAPATAMPAVQPAETM